VGVPLGIEPQRFNLLWRAADAGRRVLGQRLAVARRRRAVRPWLVAVPLLSPVEVDQLRQPTTVGLHAQLERHRQARAVARVGVRALTVREVRVVPAIPRVQRSVPDCDLKRAVRALGPGVERHEGFLVARKLCAMLARRLPERETNHRHEPLGEQPLDLVVESVVVLVHLALERRGRRAVWHEWRARKLPRRAAARGLPGFSVTTEHHAGAEHRERHEAARPRT
jgi:hypothetical protein